MPSSKKGKDSSRKTTRTDRAAEIANTFEWLITAFILAFLFRAFVMEAFRIPTGSMADTLKGAHFRLRCRQCGYEYDYGFVPEKYGFARDHIPRAPIRECWSRCPSCGFYQRTGGTMPVANGDRILVLKCIYQFFEPKQWDVLVFKDPLDPSINYIKRLVGRPGEKVEIIDGDVYINDRISRKPPKVQNRLWMPVYNNDFQPVLPMENSFNKHPWQQPFGDTPGSKWEIDSSDPTRFCLDTVGDQTHSMVYGTSIGNDFRVTYAYDDVRQYKGMPYCSDLMASFYVRSGDSNGKIGIGLSKYGIEYQGYVDLSGEMVIAKSANGRQSILRSKPAGPLEGDRPVLVRFANIDHQLILTLGQDRLTYDMGTGPDDAGERKTDIEPQVEVFGAGKLTLSHVAIFRDIHYTREKYANSKETGRATEGKPFSLGADEFFMLGDNSPNSEDSRWWPSAGKGNNGVTYRSGIVPRDYLVGKALFVYWPSGFKPFAKFPFGIIPNVGKMRFTYGGSGDAP